MERIVIEFERFRKGSETRGDFASMCDECFKMIFYTLRDKETSY